MVRVAVNMATENGEPIDIEHVAKYLPGPCNTLKMYEDDPNDFELGLDDLAPYLPPGVVMIEATPDGRPFAEAEPEAEPQQLSVTESEPEPEPDLRELWPPESVSVPVAPTPFELGEFRLALAVAKDREAIARSRLGKSVEAYQRASGTKPPTPDELFRQHAREQNAYLADIKAGRVPAPTRSRIGASVVDRMAAAQIGSGQRAGGGRAYARKAYPATMRGQRLKLPSEA
jgi:hypothetical protein